MNQIINIFFFQRLYEFILSGHQSRMNFANITKQINNIRYKRTIKELNYSIAQVNQKKAFKTMFDKTKRIDDFHINLNEKIDYLTEYVVPMFNQKHIKNIVYNNLVI